jgi:hypothetical protein
VGGNRERKGRSFCRARGSERAKVGGWSRGGRGGCAGQEYVKTLWSRKEEPAGNLKGKFAGWIALVGSSRLLAPWLAGFQLPLPPHINWPAPSLSPSVLFLPAVFLSPAFTQWIPPKILLPLTIMTISKQSHRRSRISFRLHSASSFSPLLPLPSGKTPVVRGARACTVCRAAKVCISAIRYRKFFPHHAPYR